jgi:hypothetical protein
MIERAILAGWITRMLGVIVTRQRIESIGYNLILKPMNWAAV